MTNPTWLLVGAVYAFAVWLARRGGVELRWRIAAFFYLLVLVFLWKPLTEDFVNIPIDFVQSLPPWTHLTPPHRQTNSDLNDIVLQIAPWAHQVRESWRGLDAPLWNHLSGSGYPLLANGQSSPFSLVRILALPLPLGWAFTAEAAWKILIALTFTFLYCRRRGYGELASAIGALCFGFSTFITTWLHFPLITVACFVPAALYALDLLVERRTYARFVFAAGVWAAMLFGGHPETVSHTFFIALLSLAWILFVERTVADRWRLVLTLTLGGALAVAGLLALPVLAPLAEAIPRSKRYAELKAKPNEIGYYSDWPSAIVLLQPDFFGDLPFEKSWGPSTAESITGFAGILGVGAWLALLVHVVRSRAWRSREAFFVIATVIVVGIIMAWPGISTLFHLVFKLAANARLRLLLCLLLALQTAAVADLLQRGHVRIWLVATFASAAVLLYLAKFVGFPNREYELGALAAMIPSVLTLAAAALVPLIAPRWREFGLMLVAALIAGELWSVNRDWNPTLPASLMYPKTPLIEALEAERDKQPANAPFRITGVGPLFFPNTPAVYGFEDVRAHDPMANDRYLGLLRNLAHYDTEPYFAMWKDVESTLLDYLNVKYVVAPPLANMPDPERWSLVYHGRDGRLFANRDVLPRFFAVENVILEFQKPKYAHRLASHTDWKNTAILDALKVENDRMRTDYLAPRPPGSPRAHVTITHASPTEYRMRVTAPRWSLVVSSIPWWPGWKVARAGVSHDPIRVNHAFFGFAVPPGVTEVRVWYSPWSYWAGVWVAMATLVVLIGIGVRRTRVRN